MTEVLFMLAGFAAGAAVAALIVHLLHQRRAGETVQRAANAEARASMSEQQLGSMRGELESFREQLRAAESRRETAEREVATITEQLRAKQEQLAEQRRLLEESEKKLLAVFESTGAKVLRSNTEEFLKRAEKTFEETSKPLRELLEKQNKSLDEIEKKRLEDKSGLQKHLEMIANAHEKLGTETNRLVTALRRPEQRGRWGEMQLRNVVELAGMTEHCDFNEQVQTDDPNTRDRPDMTVNLPGNAVIVVDSKVSLDAYLDSIQPDADRNALLTRHARQVENHMRQLSSKAYWSQFERTPKVVVMFMPLESALTAALEVKPDLHAQAMQQHVLIATPTLLVAMLRAIAYGWQQEAIAENARLIADAGRDLYNRLSTFVDHFQKVGVNLNRSAEAFNSAVGSLERNLLPGARRLKELHATTDDEVAPPTVVTTDLRAITADELLPRDSA